MSEPNLVSYFFDKGSATYAIVETIRRAWINRSTIGLREEHIDRAVEEVKKAKLSIDGIIHGFADKYAHHLLGHGKTKRAVMLVKGDFIGDDDLVEDTILPINLGTNYYMLFKSPGRKQSIDDYVAETQTEVFLREMKRDLLKQGYTKFRIKTSRIYFFNEDELIAKGFVGQDGSFNTYALVPYISEIKPDDKAKKKGYIVTQVVDIPEREDFREMVPSFVSYRLKSTLARKVLQKSRWKIIKNPIGDWGALRSVGSVDDKNIVLDSFQDPNSENPKKSKPIRINNYMVSTVRSSEKKKGNKFEQTKIVGEVKKGRKDAVMEFQTWSFEDLYNYEINWNSPAHHSQHEQQVQQIPSVSQFLYESYKSLVNRIFDKDAVPIDIRKL